MEIKNKNPKIRLNADSHAISAADPGRYLWLWVAIVMSGLIFAILAYNVVTNGPLLRWDQPLADSLHHYALNVAPLEKDLMVFSFYLGREVVALITVIAIIVFWRKKAWQKLVLLLAGVGGGALVWVGFSFLFGRQRPQFDNPIWKPLPWGGFPSGHALVAVTCFGLLAYFLWQRTHSSGAHTATVVVAVIIIFLIGYGRLFLGAHYVSDIIAGYAFGVFWSGIVFMLVNHFMTKSKT